MKRLCQGCKHRRLSVLQCVQCGRRECATCRAFRRGCIWMSVPAAKAFKKVAA